jgi:hypothetical protein
MTFHVPISKILFSLPDCGESDHPVFTYFDTEHNNYLSLQSKVISLASDPQHGSAGL